MIVAITGARGFVGSALIRHLNATGAQAIAISRSGERHPDAAESRAVTSYDDADELLGAVRGADAVVHLAARVHVMRETAAEPREEFRRANVQPIGALVEVARRHPLQRVVVFSSAKVYGEGRPTPYAESDRLQPHDAYAQSKADAEAMLTKSEDVPWTIIRPPLVYGPGVGGNFRRLLRLAELSRRFPLPLGAVNNRRTIVSTANLSALVEVVLHHPAAVRQSFNAGDRDDVSTTQLLRSIAQSMAIRPRLLPLPQGALRAGAMMLGRGAEADRVFGSFLLSREKVAQVLGWSAPESLDAGIEATVRWWSAR
jgi:nucleoside-diphosphate-sugar epimerase